jgi:hypothetical protein
MKKNNNPALAQCQPRAPSDGAPSRQVELRSKGQTGFTPATLFLSFRDDQTLKVQFGAIPGKSIEPPAW